ncbi:hypothetical protein GGC64_004723 [Mycobacterium sp. OAS707]|uniref:hypothetical protein n=1 Tax=Mycobacterium sp. OAS707 TaxID=2663822 RepID=UPI00178B0C85|nr:hypothetical protein [Mycobacterium sp. OAS707]MBE1550683.1 hypothetical protein [Mycobacterium sp. OAS707]
MHTNTAAATSRQFVAQPPFWGAKVASKTGPSWQESPGKSYLIMVAGILAFSAVLGGLYMGVQSLAADSSEWVQETTGEGFRYGSLALLFAGVYGWHWWSRRRKIIISLTSDGLTVSTRPGDVYSLSGAKLGTWGQTGGVTMGAALHLHCGAKRFVLGGRDRRISNGTRLDAPDAGYGFPVDIDAWLPATEFEEILSIVGRSSGLDTRPPQPGEPTRCLLFPNPLLVQEIGSFAVGKRRQFMQSVGKPRLAIEIGPDSIRVMDPYTHAVFASVLPAQVTAAPVTYRPVQNPLVTLAGVPVPTIGNVISDAMFNHWSTWPGMTVSIPGIAPLTISCRDSVSGLDKRFSWPDDVPAEHGRADYEVSGADWLTFVQTFGLAERLHTNA